MSPAATRAEMTCSIIGQKVRKNKSLWQREDVFKHVGPRRPLVNLQCSDQVAQAPKCTANPLPSSRGHPGEIDSHVQLVRGDVHLAAHLWRSRRTGARVQLAF